MEANIMAGRAPLALMLMAVMLSSGLAGCLGDEALELLPKRKAFRGSYARMSSQQHVHLNGD